MSHNISTSSATIETNYLKPINQQYEPGVCNIGPEEIAKRKRALYVSIVAFLGQLTIITIFELGILWTSFSFFFLVIVFVNGLQVRNKFCVYFGFFSIVNFGDLSKGQRVRDNDDKKRDMKKVRIMLLQSILLSAIVTIFLIYLMQNLS